MWIFCQPSPDFVQVRWTKGRIDSIGYTKRRGARVSRLVWPSSITCYSLNLNFSLTLNINKLYLIWLIWIILPFSDRRSFSLYALPIVFVYFSKFLYHKENKLYRLLVSQDLSKRFTWRHKNTFIECVGVSHPCLENVKTFLGRFSLTLWDSN